MFNFRKDLLIMTGAASVFMAEALSSGLTNTILAIAPSLAWLWFFTMRERASEKRWQNEVAVSLSSGFLAAPLFVATGEALAHPIASLVGGDPLGWFVIRAGLIEELSKLAGLALVIRFSMARLTHPKDAMCLSIASALGFATYENFFHNSGLSQLPAATALGFVFLGVAVRIPLHALYAALWGSAVGVRHFSADRHRGTVLVLFALALSIFFHGLWDTLVQSWKEPITLLTVAAMYALLWVGFLKLRKAIGGLVLSTRADDERAGQD